MCLSKKQTDQNCKILEMTYSCEIRTAMITTMNFYQPSFGKLNVDRKHVKMIHDLIQKRMTIKLNNRYFGFVKPTRNNEVI